MNLGFLRKKIGILISTMLLVALMASCAPEQRVLDAETEDLGTTSTDTPAVPPESVATVPEVINLLQVGTTRYTQILNLFSDYKDSFLIRGNELTQYLASLPNPMTHRLCLLMDFPGVTGTGSKKVLAMGAR